jgi:hypothetical protein
MAERDFGAEFLKQLRAANFKASTPSMALITAD